MLLSPLFHKALSLGKGPFSGSIKFNFDGSLLDGGSTVGIGVVARNESSACLAWISRRVDRKGNGELVEAFWLLRRLSSLLLVVDGRRLLLRETTLLLINKLRVVDRDLSYVGIVVLDILQCVIVGN
ncbi:hypothetical protein Salat_0878400 [Sesamum alatum]|uniref:RNase H type-1 domain-containing protein n=1 Tax=Sesamum alatum TaxID=300844 RepID=A0AAE2CQV6_9LAMI|nr:hypothetical protein Salat_0878400 [Sesamum alatum]